tara:strand:+ start:9249 stop:9479 length:231 start_codon:yes stop_codon:yes gene_type:complete
MTYTIKRKEKRPAGDWLIIAVNGNKVFHYNSNSELTDTEILQLAEKQEAQTIAQDAEIAEWEAEEAARIAAEEAEE